MSPNVFESEVKAAALDWVGAPGHTILPGPIIAPGGLTAERAAIPDALPPKLLSGQARVGD